MSLKSSNQCQIAGYFGTINFGSSSLTKVSLGFTSFKFTGSLTPTTKTGTLEFRLLCNNGKGYVYLDTATVKLATVAATTSKTSTASKTSTTSTSTSTTAKVSTTSTAIASIPVREASSTSTSTTSTAKAVTSSAETKVASSSTTSTSSTSSTSAAAAASGKPTIDTTILVIAPSDYSASSGAAGLLAYGIPHELLVVPKEGVTLPTLNSSATHGNYGGFIVMDSVSYEYDGSWASAITTAQWSLIHEYQVEFNVRMVRINEYPGTSFGTTVVSGGCCDSSISQSISFTDVSDFPTANIKADAELSTTGLYHVPAAISDSSTTKQVAKFGTATGFESETVAAVINNFNGREQFVWFIGWAPDWSQTSSFLQHAHVHWMTRGLFLGKRKVHLSCQVDDLQLSTELYYPSGEEFKIDVEDLEAHITWQNNINARMPTGSDFWLELGHNGNGDLIASTLSTSGEQTCDPEYAVYYDMAEATALEFQKPLGTGEDIWPAEFEEYSWSKTCATLDTFANWFTVADNLNQFAHVSHTFAHLSLNNATYHDANREIQFNQDWLAMMGIDKANRFSPHGLIPPAITGMHNGDAIQAWMDNGITYVVGDNTRPVLRNTQSVYWPLISTVADNGYAGLTIVPRFSTAIYYNCDTAECTTREWIATSAGSGNYSNLLANSKSTNVRNLLSLQADPYMFHQANMRQSSVDTITIGDQTGSMSLVMSWTETMVQELLRLTKWPIQSLKHDDLAAYFINRKALDACTPKLAYTYSTDGTKIESVTVSATDNTCSVPIPVTIPSGSSTASGGSVTADVVGSEPPIQWVTLSGSPVTLTLSSPVSF
ncbi:hypothetical protein EDB81DRAFT_652594 [Dactylonectria macrodidyma]|uniref:Extracellular serine-rich protein n=1 Tax=Dactylonectria macrodidyma TaxID=307937 RepID=A0A9P9J5P1_9HYPO|nr:hypothetical protein EDB81DRAFT_652594 [Dactylonectria macrodidyma]